jgi:hypothetical protein
MSRPRSTVLKVGDKVSHNKKDGVVVFVEPNSSKPYSVHFHPEGRGLFRFSDLEKVRPMFNMEELEEDEIITTKETIDV